MASELAGADLVSVIVTTKNSATTLEACLSSIRAQTHQSLEMIVVDNHSADGTVAVATRFADVVERRGPERSAQRNHGAQLAAGRFFMFVDADMVLSPGVLADCVATAQATTARAVIVPETSVGEGFWGRCRMLERNCYIGDDLVEAARFYRREAFWSAGGFDEGLTGAEDWDLSMRVGDGRRLPRTAAQIVHYEGRTSLRSAFRKKRYYAQGYLRYLKKHGGRAAGQGSVVLRPAFWRHRGSLSRRPVLAAGLLYLKAVEASAVLLVAVRLRLGRHSLSGPEAIYQRHA